MAFFLKAACLCNTGRIRSNNEDNFLFRGKHLPEQNSGLEKALCYSWISGKPRLLGVFDGMGGEQFGETASFVAAQTASAAVPDKENIAESLDALCQEMNQKVFEAAQAHYTTHMGATVALLCFSGKQVYAGNLGDSRIFRHHLGVLERLSEDHTDEKALQSRGIKRKPRLTQHLGIDPQELRLVPHTVACGLQRGDRYLICSDGLTDMVSEDQICQLLQQHRNPTVCAKALVQEALENGGRDNVTVIVCAVQ